MRRIILGLLPTILTAQSLEEGLNSKIAAFGGVVSLYAKNLDTDAAVGIRENDLVRTASTIKLPIMAAVFDAVGARQGEMDRQAHRDRGREGLRFGRARE